MNKSLLDINPEEKKIRIIKFIKEAFAKQKMSKAVIGISGGIDSAVSFTLLKEALKPENIIVAHLYYFKSKFGTMKKFINQSGVPERNIHHISIKKPVNTMAETLHILKARDTLDTSDTLRLGNIAARMRMIILYDFAKKYNALVCGTENKSENLLGYFTRFGDQASDIEPIEHLYKTQIVQLAKYLEIPKTIIKQTPSAGLWQGQTDEGQFGFTYEEADQVLFLYFEKKFSLDEIEKQGFPNAKKIIDWHDKNIFKRQTPYTIRL